MLKIKMADFIIVLENKFSHIEMLCKDYIYNGEESPDFTVSCTMEEISHERENSQEGYDFSDGYLESICLYRKICLQLPQYDAFVMHSAVIEADGEAYAFAARSGTGKSTHISLWKKYLGPRVDIVNGDKPIMRFIDGVLYAYGTPWCGKEGWQRNVRSPLKAICYIERAEENRIEKLGLDVAADRIMKQVLIPTDALGAIKTLELVDRMIRSVGNWLLGCNISIEAAELAYKTMSGGEK